MTTTRHDVPVADCAVCDWTYEPDDADETRRRVAVNRAMIDHHVATGHGPVRRLASSVDAADEPRI